MFYFTSRPECKEISQQQVHNLLADWTELFLQLDENCCKSTVLSVRDPREHLLLIENTALGNHVSACLKKKLLLVPESSYTHPDAAGGAGVVLLPAVIFPWANSRAGQDSALQHPHFASFYTLPFDSHCRKHPEEFQ
ncbi:hypothetical protein ATANTOWER_007188 [Ataeniobius toweri]|uniref:Uncharacterized protein n=1 Tax=Ataeniobius toweri TaxID=208326 RepID=A0ABU7AE53_9TELE|nr:hypothetical protein [Ataeniobius toweri]